MGWNYRRPSCGAVALAQLQRRDELVEMRVLRRAFLEAVKPSAGSAAGPSRRLHVNSWWAYVMALDMKKVDWFTFRLKFKELGGDACTGMVLGYLGPCTGTAIAGARRKSGDFAKGLCPVAKTSCRVCCSSRTTIHEADAVRQAMILRKTCEFLRLKGHNEKSV
jgi:hypothetical protein